MRFNIITIFPEQFAFLENYGVLGKAIKNGIIELNLLYLRDFSLDKNKSVDDEIYGRGPGMLMTPGPLYRAIQSLPKSSKVLSMSPQGKILNNDLANKLSDESELTIICGHYEGIDQRITDNYVDMEVSIGDYILTGGELSAMVLIDVISRFVPGVVGNKASVEEDTFYKGLLKYPSYTRPREFMGHKVPDILLSGDHGKIDKWRKEQAIKNTKKKRPDLLDKLDGDLE